MLKRPSAEQLVTAVRQFLGELQPRLTGPDGFQVRVSVHLLGIVERELADRAELDRRERHTIRPFVGENGSTEELSRRLCREIRAGSLDERWDELLEALTRLAEDEVRLVSPARLKDVQ
jgi:hypothetical protein